jgi:CHAT domain-containing protein
VLESIRRRLTSPTLRSTYVASVRDTYELYVDVLMGLHRQQPGRCFDERALEASEMGRARGLLDLLNEAGLQVREGVDEALMTEERAVQEQLGAALDRQLRVSQGPHTEEQTQAAARAVQAMTAEWEATRGRMKARSPRFAALREPVPSTLAEIRTDVLDADTVLLEYALGERRSFLWVVTRETLASHELPARAVIEKAAREAHASLAEPRSPSAGSAVNTDTLTHLSQMILGPAAASLGAKRLLIVADGALHYLPFAALPDPSHPRETLLARHEVVGAPSASVLALLRRERERRPPAAKAVAVLADPVFARDDQRFRVRPMAGAASAKASPAGDALQRALRDGGVESGLPRLPFTRREADAILSLVPSTQGKRALDFDANRATVTDPSLAEYRVVHFATHGFLNSAKPELSGIVLSLFEPDGDEARGFLTTTDIFNLHLNADLVVLSGCRTALGKEMRGEGLVGLSRGFMYAGAPRVMASLWRVDDAATAELMKRLYRGMLKQGLPPARALRVAQLDLMRRPRFRHPFYWAAFQLQGEWR